MCVKMAQALPALKVVRPNRIRRIQLSPCLRMRGFAFIRYCVSDVCQNGSGTACSESRASESHQAYPVVPVSSDAGICFIMRFQRYHINLPEMLFTDPNSIPASCRTASFRRPDQNSLCISAAANSVRPDYTDMHF